MICDMMVFGMNGFAGIMAAESSGVPVMCAGLHRSIMLQPLQQKTHDGVVGAAADVFGGKSSKSTLSTKD